MQIAQISDRNVWGFLLRLICLHIRYYANVHINMLICAVSLKTDFVVFLLFGFFFPWKISYSVAILAIETWVQLSQGEKPKC